MSNHNEHYILPDKLAVKVWSILLVLTVITVGLSYVNLGAVNYLVGMLVASVKAALVALIFMNLAKDHKSNLVIFCTGFIFLFIFVGLTASDLWFRGDVNTVRGQPLLKASNGPSKFKKAWEPSPELVAHGKAVFAQNCVSCHGDNGKGDGPAAAALNPRPRNFTGEAGWINGHKPSQIFKTLKEGVGSGMASFATLPQDDRWGLAHYVASLNPNVLKDTAGDLAKIGVDPSKEGGGEVIAKTIPVEFAMEQMVKDAGSPKQNVTTGDDDYKNYDQRLKAKTFSK